MLCFCLLFSYQGRAQDMHFSQFYVMPLIVNPANAGLEYDIDAGAIYRQQWRSVTQPFTSYGISGSARIGKSRKRGILGIGLDCFYDRSGTAAYTSLQAGLNVAYNVRLGSKSFLGAGLKLNFNQRSINGSALQWGEQYDGRDYNGSLPTGENLAALQTNMFVDVAGGLNYRFKSGEKYMDNNNTRILDVGVAGFHINRGNVSLYNTFKDQINSRYIIYADGFFGIDNTNLSLLPKGYYQVQGEHQELMLGLLLNLKTKDDSRVTGFVNGSSISLGALFRNRDAVVAVLQYQFRNYQLGFAYDVNVSKLTTASTGRGALEISLRYTNAGAFLRKGHHKAYGK